MTLQRIVATMAEWVPQRVKAAVRGRRASPNLLATAIHSILNSIPIERYPILPCGGALKGFCMRVDWKVHRSFVYGSWEPEVVECIQKHVTPGMTVLDIGAQSGFFSLLLSKRVGPAGKVIAFEPLPANFRILEENIRLNGLKNVTVRNEAVAERSGDMSFEFPRHEPGLIAGPVLAGDSQAIFTVRGISLDDWLSANQFPVQFIKMDVEGAEVEVLRGALKMLDSCHPDMLIELHNMVRHSGPHPAAILVEELGYEIRWLGEIASTAHILARWAPKSSQNTAIPDESARGTSGATTEPATWHV